MTSGSSDTDAYYSDPSRFIEYRNQIESVDPNRFNALFGAMSRIVLAYPEYYFQTESGDTKTYFASGNQALMGDKTDVIEEIDGPRRTPDNRAIDLRLFTKEHSLRKRLGFMAYIGIDWKPTPHLADVVSSEVLTAGLLGGGLHIQGDFGKIDSLWVLSSDNRNNWITTYDDPRPITDFEYGQLVDDLMAYPSI